MYQNVDNSKSFTIVSAWLSIIMEANYYKNNFLQLSRVHNNFTLALNIWQQKIINMYV